MPGFKGCARSVGGRDERPTGTARRVDADASASAGGATAGDSPRAVRRHAARRQLAADTSIASSAS